MIYILKTSSINRATVNSAHKEIITRKEMKLKERTIRVYSIEEENTIGLLDVFSNKTMVGGAR